MELTPEVIDAMVMQLKAVFEHSTGIPEKVKNSGLQFVADCDEWSDEMKKARKDA
jgi:hypothetical protein